MQKEHNNDKWVKNGMMFICDVRGYVVTPSLKTVCVGLVDEEGNVLEDVYKRIENASLTEEGVAKIDTNTNHLNDDIQDGGDNNYATSKKRGRGRPPKEGNELHRTTLWRRRKKEELQGVLPL